MADERTPSILTGGFSHGRFRLGYTVTEVADMLSVHPDAVRKHDRARRAA
jgi:hypothetical protein